MDLFAQATRMKLRFETPQGNLSVEQLWELRLTGNSSQANLDDIAKGLFQELKEGEVESFVKTAAASTASKVTKLKFDVVKAIIDARLEDAEKATKAKEDETRRDQIKALIQEKEAESLRNLSLEELKALAAK